MKNTTADWLLYSMSLPAHVAQTKDIALKEVMIGMGRTVRKGSTDRCAL